jgi:hypothetical protein
MYEFGSALATVFHRSGILMVEQCEWTNRLATLSLTTLLQWMFGLNEQDNVDSGNCDRAAARL